MIGALILLWIAIGITNLGIINKISMTALFILTLVLSFIIFRGGVSSEGSLSDAMAASDQ